MQTYKYSNLPYWGNHIFWAQHLLFQLLAANVYSEDTVRNLLCILYSCILGMMHRRKVFCLEMFRICILHYEEYGLSAILIHLSFICLLHPRPLVRSAEAGGFGLAGGGGVEFAVGGGWGGFCRGHCRTGGAGVCSGRSVDAALEHGIGAGGFYIILPLAQSDGYFCKRLHLVL